MDSQNNPAGDGPLKRPVRPLSPGAQKALMKLALLNPMNPSTDGYAWAGRHGAALVARGYAKPNGRDALGFKCFTPTPAGKAEGLRLYELTATRKA